MGTWARTVLADLDWEDNTSLLVKIPRGATLLRTRFGWGFYGDTSATTDLQNVSQNLQVMGLCTTYGTGGEAVPDARIDPTDQDPPTNRWIYWEARAPRLAAYNATAELAFWQDSGAQEPVDSKSMVSSKTIPEGDTLNLWASWSAASAWDDTGNVNLWLWASILYQEAS
jgi:hypothetical protein